MDWVMGIYWDNGSQNGNSCLGFRVSYNSEGAPMIRI